MIEDDERARLVADFEMLQSRQNELATLVGQFLNTCVWIEAELDAVIEEYFAPDNVSIFRSEVLWVFKVHQKMGLVKKIAAQIDMEDEWLSCKGALGIAIERRNRVAHQRAHFIGESWRNNHPDLVEFGLTRSTGTTGPPDGPVKTLGEVEGWKAEAMEAWGDLMEFTRLAITKIRSGDPPEMWWHRDGQRQQ